MTTFEPKTRVRIKTPKPLPSGRTVQLVGMVWYVENGVYVVRVPTPGMYCGGVLRLTAGESDGGVTCKSFWTRTPKPPWLPACYPAAIRHC